MAVAIQTIQEKDNDLKSQLNTVFTFNEYFEASGRAIVRKNFNIKKDFKIDGLSIGYTGDGRNLGGSSILSAIQFVVKAKANRVKKFDVSLESAALYNGQWGGSKFRVINE